VSVVTMEYAVEGHNTMDDPITIMCPYDPLDSDMDATFAAEFAAGDYHAHHNGWEASWPFTLTLRVNGTEIGPFEVERESTPQFVAIKLEAKRS
jgi:hypothetical protein